MNASLNKMLQDVEWGEYKVGALFKRIKTKKLPYKAEELPRQATGDYVLPCLTSSFRNQGLNYYAPKEGATVLKNVISIPSNSDVYRAYYQSSEFTVLSDAYAIRWKSDTIKPTENQYLFMVICINRVIDRPIYSYKNKLGGWNVVQKKYIKLPTKNGAIDFNFMDSFIAKLQEERLSALDSYLSVAGLKDSKLTKEEEKLLSVPLEWKEFDVNKLFDITKTSSFDSDKLVPGEMYDYVTRTSLNQGILQSTGFVEGGETNNAGTWSLGLMQMEFFYRKKPWYAGQFVRKIIPKISLTENQALFLTAALNMQKKRLLSVLVRDVDKTFLNGKIWLPANGEEIDYETIETFSAAIKKLIIKDVANYSVRKGVEKQSVLGNSNVTKG